MTADATDGRTASGTGPSRRPYATGALCVCGAVLAFSILDVSGKWLSGSYPLHELLVLRCLTLVPLLGVLAWRSGGGLAGLRVERPWLVMLRGLILVHAYSFYALSIAALPLADAVAIGFLMPLVVAGLAWPVLGERVPGYRWLAILGGLLGVVVMLKPGGGVLEPAAVLALIGTFLYGLGQMMARLLGGTRTWSIAFYQSLVYLGVGVSMAVLLALLPPVAYEHKSLAFLLRPWVMPPPGDLALMLGLGPLSALGMPLYVHGYKVAPASFSASFEYTAMIWAALFGYLLFGDLPGPATWAGAAVVVAAGLFMLHMDRRSGHL